MRRLVLVAGFVFGLVLAVTVGIAVTLFASLNPTWVSVQVPVLEGIGEALERGSAVRGRPFEARLWFLVVMSFVAGLLASVVLALVVWLAGLGSRLGQRRYQRALERECAALREQAAARMPPAAPRIAASPPSSPSAASPALPSPGRTPEAGPLRE